jgi:Putative DNA-binding domain
MNNQLFEQLLYEDESTTLDFKKKQYLFAKATEEEKSELLKDILGFANAWRRSEAYILIGVKDVKGGRSNIIGIPATDHLDDHSLQQFVNNLTNQPVRFHYEAFGFEGKQVGIIRIDEQTRPIYLKKDYGKLAREKVYVRRGSSTDPTKPASLEEIAQMRVGSGQPAAELLVEFAHVKRDDALGTTISWSAEFCEMPEKKTIPILSYPPRPYPFDRDPAMNDLNRDFFCELANFEFIRRLFQPIRIVVKNVGQVAANNVRVELTVPRSTPVGVMYASEIPDRPKRNAYPISSTVQYLCQLRKAEGGLRGVNTA